MTQRRWCGYLVDEKLLDAGGRLCVRQSLGHVLEEEMRVEGDHLVEAEQRVHLPRGPPARTEEQHGEGRRYREGAEDEALGAAILDERVVQPEPKVVVDLNEEALGAAHPGCGRRQTLVALRYGWKFYRRSVVVMVMVIMVPLMVTMVLLMVTMVAIMVPIVLLMVTIVLLMVAMVFFVVVILSVMALMMGIDMLLMLNLVACTISVSVIVMLAEIMLVTMIFLFHFVVVVMILVMLHIYVG